MSFILDALRKSEHERQRGAVPGISNVPFAVPRRETPRWMVALVAVLLLAVVALGGAWWRSSKVASTPVAVTVPLDIPPPVPAAAPETRAARTEPAPPPEESRAARIEPPPVAATTPADARPVSPSVADADASAPARTSAPPPRESDSAAPPLPSPTALAAEGIAVPPLHLELHAYSDRASERFVFINGRKYVEGEQLAEGPRLVSIERSGAVLSQQGRRFMLTQ
ncbi:MAG TPA: general secretion pathway protein GspB [Gammaproteobacteria bacterium]|nr:general secretion pathway protein GspB [Gammaproteobacteria bacterium]